MKSIYKYTQKRTADGKDEIVLIWETQITGYIAYY